MKKFSILLAGFGIATAALPGVASAAPWAGVDQRQSNIERRIDQGVRSGTLTRGEAFRLRGDLHGLMGLESRYRRTGGGLDRRERADLDRRLNALSARIYGERHDREDRRDRHDRDGRFEQPHRR